MHVLTLASTAPTAQSANCSAASIAASIAVINGSGKCDGSIYRQKMSIEEKHVGDGGSNIEHARKESNIEDIKYSQ